ANTGWLQFDATGALDGFCFGNEAGSGSCPADTDANVWYVQAGFMQYGAPGFDSLGNGSVTYSLASVAATPEPGTLVMLGTALLAGAGLARRRLRV
ncbi:MAG TPA: PEP-CTERM sorting domain-containing protein, partial [Acidobacteriaceae bacterium]|nr:PEP-CTERM sorting domain-containing protein [Acidobacteriaceae bacterium]